MPSCHPVSRDEATKRDGVTKAGMDCGAKVMLPFLFEPGWPRQWETATIFQSSTEKVELEV